MDNTILEKLLQIMAICFKCDPNILTKESKMDSISEWDSLNHMKLIIMIEQEFDIQFEDIEMVQLISVDVIMYFIENKSK